MTLATLLTAAMHLAGAHTGPAVHAAHHAVDAYRAEYPATRLDADLLVAVGIVESRLQPAEAGRGVGQTKGYDKSVQRTLRTLRQIAKRQEVRS